jgi:hypothetical protein
MACPKPISPVSSASIPRPSASTIATRLDTGHIKATAKVAEFLFRKATTDGSQAVTAAIFWLKTRGGWKETTVNEMAGPVKVELTWQEAQL